MAKMLDLEIGEKLEELTKPLLNDMMQSWPPCQKTSLWGLL